LPKLNQKYKVSPVKKEVVYEATQVVINLPISDMDNIAVMDSDDFFTHPISANVPNTTTFKANKKRKKADNSHVHPLSTDELDEEDAAKANKSDKRIKLNAFVIPKGMERPATASYIQVKQEVTVEEEPENPNSYVSRLKQF